MMMRPKPHLSMNLAAMPLPAPAAMGSPRLSVAQKLSVPPRLGYCSLSFKIVKECFGKV
jgi:hypothetical protein